MYTQTLHVNTNLVNQSSHISLFFFPHTLDTTLLNAKLFTELQKKTPESIDNSNTMNLHIPNVTRKFTTTQKHGMRN